MKCLNYTKVCHKISNNMQKKKKNKKNNKQKIK